jgi:hypothetical protein
MATIKMSKYYQMPSLVSLQERYTYDPETGSIAWAIDSPNGQRFKGDPAGGVNNEHGHRIKINNRLYKTSRIAWFMATGQDPGNLHVDHINGDIYDNRLSNLRLVTCSQNQANSTAARAGRLLPKGVYRRGSRYRAAIKANGTMLCLGTFDTPKEAHAAYMAKAKELWGDYATDRKVPSFYRSSKSNVQESA